MKRAIIDAPCPRCGARPSKPCRSARELPLAEAHEERIEKARGKGWRDEYDLAPQMAYKKAVVVFVFGRCSKDLLWHVGPGEIDPRQKWVRDAVAGPLPGFHREAIEPRYLERPRETHGVKREYQLELGGVL